MVWEGYRSRLCKCNNFNQNGLFGRDTQTQRLPALVGGYGLSELCCASFSRNVVRNNPKVLLGVRPRA
jgi:hypothetical protein